MTKHKKNEKAVDFQEYLAKQLKDPKVRKYYEQYGKQLEVAYQVLQLRKKQGLSQVELAKKIGTKQSNIARIEAGQQNFTTAMLQKIASALNYNLKIEFVE